VLAGKAPRPARNGHELRNSGFPWVEFDGADDQAGSGVCGAAGGVAQAGANGLDRGLDGGG
jgi:hypothetical protein